MTVIKITQYDNDQGMTMQGAITTANQRKLRLLSNTEIDERLNKTGEWKQEKEMYPCWTGTLIVYAEPGAPFGKTVTFRDLTLNVPKQFQGKVNCAIVCNHPDFTLKDNTLTPGKSARCIAFPVNDGQYLPEKEFGVPNGEKSGFTNSAARHLWRRNESYVGLLARGFDYYDRRDVYAYYDCDCRLGVFGDTRRGKNFKCKHEWIKVCKHCGEERRP